MKNDGKSSEGLITILIIDDHALLRNGLRGLLTSFKELNIRVVEAESGEQALQRLITVTVDLAIVDYQLQGMSGPETVRRLLRHATSMKVLALSNFCEYKCIDDMLNAGALGYIMKSVEPEQLLTAVKTVLSGRKYYCSDVAQVLIDAAEKSGAEKKLKYNITARELEVLLMIAQEMTNEEIAKKLFVARRTVDKHRQNLLAKLRVKNTAGLVRFAVESNLLK